MPITRKIFPADYSQHPDLPPLEDLPGVIDQESHKQAREKLSESKSTWIRLKEFCGKIFTKENTKKVALRALEIAAEQAIRATITVVLLEINSRELRVTVIST